MWTIKIKFFFKKCYFQLIWLNLNSWIFYTFQQQMQAIHLMTAREESSKRKGTLKSCHNYIEKWQDRDLRNMLFRDKTSETPPAHFAWPSTKPKVDQEGFTLWEQQGVVIVTALPSLVHMCCEIKGSSTLCSFHWGDSGMSFVMFFNCDVYHILSNALIENGLKQAFIVNTGLSKWLLLLVILFSSFFFFSVKELLNAIPKHEYLKLSF